MSPAFIEINVVAMYLAISTYDNMYCVAGKFAREKFGGCEHLAKLFKKLGFIVTTN